MTAKTSQHLADALRAAGFTALAEGAERDEFHDFLSKHDEPSLALDAHLLAIINGKVSNEHKAAARALRSRHHNGEFDASKEESDEWAASPEGQNAFERLITEKRDMK
jgi:hypothetical protein